MKRGVGSTTLCLALLMGVAACDDNPLSEGREDAAYFMLNPTATVVEAGDTTKVLAIVMNQYGTPTNAPVTAEPCDSKITATADPNRSAFESPETFLVVGQTLGLSCLVVRGAGLTDTANVRVVPASIVGSGVDTVQSGAQDTVNVQFRSITGGAVTGFTNAQLSFTSLDTLVVAINSAGVVSARAPGSGRIVISTLASTGAVRVDTVVAVVKAGTYAGTVTPAAPAEGSIMSLSAPAGLQYDNDTQVIVNGVTWPWVLSRTATTLTFVAPPTGSVVLSNIGASQVALNANLPIVSREPADNGTGTQRVLAETDSMWFSLGGNDALDVARLVVPAGGGTYRFTLDWNPNGGTPTRDLDIIFFNEAGAFMGYGGQYGGCATGSRPEGCTLTLAAGTWYAAVELYDGDATTAKMVVRRQ